jgi:hypothetical protein
MTESAYIPAIPMGAADKVVKLYPFRILRIKNRREFLPADK